MDEKLRNLTKAVLNICRKSHTWGFDFESPAFIGLLKNAANYGQIKDSFDADTFIQLLDSYLQEYGKTCTGTITGEEAETFFLDLCATMQSMVSTHYIFISLPFASLSKSIHFSHFDLIAGSREEKIAKIGALAKINPHATQTRAEHMEIAKSPGFFSYPILAIKIRHQTDHVEKVSGELALWCIYALRAINCGFIHLTPNLPMIKVGTPFDTRHLMYYSQNGYSWNCIPLRFDPICNIDLDWLSERKYQNRFRDIYNEVIRPTSLNSVSDFQYRFFRALQFFGKSITAEKQRNIFEGLGLPILFLTIACETLLFERSGEINNRLTVLLPKLSKPPFVSREECAKAVHACYLHRNDFVHNAIEPSFLRDPNSISSVTEGQVELLKQMVAKLIIDGPKYLSKYESWNLWNSYLNEIWQKTLGIA